MATVIGTGTYQAANNAAVTPTINTGAAAGDLVLACCFYSSPGGTMAVNAAYTPAIKLTAVDCKLMVAVAYWHSGIANPTFTPSGGAAGDGISAQTIVVRDAPGIGCYGPISINAAQKDIIVQGTGNPFTKGLIFALGGRNAGFTNCVPPATAQGLTWTELFDLSDGSLGVLFECDYAPFSTNIVPTSKTITAAAGSNTSLAVMFVVPDHASETIDRNWIFVGDNATNTMTTDTTYRNVLGSWGAWAGFTGYKFRINQSEGPTVDGGAGAFTNTQAALTALVQAGLPNHELILNNPNQQVTGGVGTAAELTNYRWYCKQAFQISFGAYYVLGRGMGSTYTAAQSVALQQKAWDAKNEVNSGLWLESVTADSPMDQFSTDLLNAGITRYCDSYGVRTSMSLLREGQGLTKAWNDMFAANVASGYPIKPLIVNELYHDYNDTTIPAGNRNLEFKSLLVWWSYVQLKRYGILSAIYYPFADSANGVTFDYFDHDGATYGADVPYPFIFNELATIAKKWPMRNGDFEEQQAHTYITTGVSGLFKLGWITYFDPTGDLSDFNRCQIVSDAGAPRAGTYCLKQGVGGYNRTRRVVEGLTPGSMYRVTGYCTAASGTTQLQVMGYNIYNGNEVSAQSNTGAGAYLSHTVTFTPTQDWAVISLESDGTAVAYWDDITITDASVPYFKAHHPMLSLLAM